MKQKSLELNWRLNWNERMGNASDGDLSSTVGGMRA